MQAPQKVGKRTSQQLLLVIVGKQVAVAGYSDDQRHTRPSPVQFGDLLVPRLHRFVNDCCLSHRCVLSFGTLLETASSSPR